MGARATAAVGGGGGAAAAGELQQVAAASSLEYSPAHLIAGPAAPGSLNPECWLVDGTVRAPS